MFRVVIEESKAFVTDSDLEKRDYALLILQAVFNSKEFKERILNFKSPAGERFLRNNGMTNEEIFKFITKSGKGLSSKERTARLKLDLDHDKGPKGVIGYIFNNGDCVHTYYEAFQWLTITDYAGHIAHEWMHLLDFDHYGTRDKDIKYTVPYMVGELVIEIGGKFFV